MNLEEEEFCTIQQVKFGKCSTILYSLRNSTEIYSSYHLNCHKTSASNFSVFQSTYLCSDKSYLHFASSENKRLIEKCLEKIYALKFLPHCHYFNFHPQKLFQTNPPLSTSLHPQEINQFLPTVHVILHEHSQSALVQSYQSIISTRCHSSI